ncbi:unnamed protein product [Rotaria sp. Silwood1]|nr:unnamed protein product [Rotaria sp. Silwood1]CAF1527364.1 unnamed protein product [Rotaria sp. Silwood1]
MFKEKYLRRSEITTSKDVSLMKLQNDPRVPSQSDNSIYDLYTIPKDADDDSDVFNYTTSNDIISTLINGDHEIIRTLDLLIHITKVKLSETNLNAELILPPCPNKSTRIKAATSGRDWVYDEVQIEGDEDDLNRKNLNNNQDEHDEGWGDTEIELPPDLTRKVLSVRKKNPIAVHPLNYDEYNPFNICAASYVPHLS